MINIGHNPTCNPVRELSVEANLLDCAEAVSYTHLLQMDYDLTGVHPVIAWNGLGKEGRLQLDFTMSESAGLTRGAVSYTHLLETLQRTQLTVVNDDALTD